MASVNEPENVGGTYSYLVADAQGSVNVALSSGGAVTASQLFAPYGATRYSSGVMPTSYGYTGQRSDPSGLAYFHARYYDPTVGQFISADSAQGLNRYGYVQGNPTTLTDPSGNMACAVYADGLCQRGPKGAPHPALTTTGHEGASGQSGAKGDAVGAPQGGIPPASPHFCDACSGATSQTCDNVCHARNIVAKLYNATVFIELILVSLLSWGFTDILKLLEAKLNAISFFLKVIEAPTLIAKGIVGSYLFINAVPLTGQIFFSMQTLAYLLNGGEFDVAQIENAKTHIEASSLIGTLGATFIWVIQSVGILGGAYATADVGGADIAVNAEELVTLIDSVAFTMSVGYLAYAVNQLNEAENLLQK